MASGEYSSFPPAPPTWTSCTAAETKGNNTRPNEIGAKIIASDCRVWNVRNECGAIQLLGAEKTRKTATTDRQKGGGKWKRGGEGKEGICSQGCLTTMYFYEPNDWSCCNHAATYKARPLCPPDWYILDICQLSSNNKGGHGALDDVLDDSPMHR